jgi:CHASE3 domain sensor protein
MTDERKKVLNIGRKIGALLGGIMFLLFGIVPAFYFGSFGTLTMISHLAGGPVEAGIIVRMLVVAGIVLGFVCSAFVSIVLGAVVGTTLAYITDVISSAFKHEPEKANAYAEK